MLRCLILGFNKIMITELCERLLDWLGDKAAVFIVAIIFLSIIGIGFLIYAFYLDAVSDKIVLTKTNWVCMKTDTFPITTFTYSGNIAIPVTTYVTECVNYQKR